MLDDMQKDLPGTVHILGINEAGHESGNDSFTSGRDLPWLQERPGDNVWKQWSVTYRDVVIVDAEGERLDVYNLTDNDLNTADAYDDLLDILQTAALTLESSE